jgi:hypothetical protein
MNLREMLEVAHQTITMVFIIGSGLILKVKLSFKKF